MCRSADARFDLTDYAYLPQACTYGLRSMLRQPMHEDSWVEAKQSLLTGYAVRGAELRLLTNHSHTWRIEECEPVAIPWLVCTLTASHR